MTFSLEELLAIFAFSLVASISPGPVNLLILSTGGDHEVSVRVKRQVSSRGVQHPEETSFRRAHMSLIGRGRLQRFGRTAHDRRVALARMTQ